MYNILGLILLIGSGEISFDILKIGEGQIVQPYNVPLVHYKGHSFDEVIDLQEIDQELAQGVIGMREGEVRRIYLHSKQVAIELELLQADTSAGAHAASNDYPSPPFLENERAIR